MNETLSNREPPRSRWYYARIALMLLALAAFIIPFPNPGRTVDRLLDVGHVFFFGALACGLIFWLQQIQPIAIAAILGALISLCIGIAIELVQPYFGRKWSLHDIGADFGGALAGGAFMFGLAQKNRGVRWACILFGAGLAIATACIVFLRWS